VNVLLSCVQLDYGYLLQPKHAAVCKLNNVLFDEFCWFYSAIDKEDESP
jgi:hypothetical protein